jgi:hypothetical protein
MGGAVAERRTQARTITDFDQTRRVVPERLGPLGLALDWPTMIGCVVVTGNGWGMAAGFVLLIGRLTVISGAA